jgi:hypothetical protein
MTKRVERLLVIIAFLMILAAFINFFAFMAVSRQIGGDALNGYERDGHFYLSSRSIDDIDKEVPEATWRQARLHGESVFVTVALAMFSMAFLVFRYGLPTMMFGGNYKQTREERQKAVDDVRASGPPIASLISSGRVGGVYVQGPLISADVHPIGLSISTIFSSPCAIRTEQIREVRYRRGIWHHVVEVKHTSRVLSRSVILDRVKEDSDFAKALNALVGPERVIVTK